MRIFYLSFTTKHLFILFTCPLVNCLQRYEEYPDTPNIPKCLAAGRYEENGGRCALYGKNVVTLQSDENEWFTK